MALTKAAIIAISVVIPVVVIAVVVAVAVVLTRPKSSSVSPVTTDLTVPLGGTGRTSLTAGNVLVGNGANPILTTKPAPTGDFVGVSDTQTLTNKTIDSSTLTSGNVINSLSAPLPVNSGGTGKTTLTSGSVLTGLNTTAIDDTVQQPTGNFVGTTDTQTLTNKTLDTCTISSLNTPIPVSQGGTGGSSFTASKVLTGNGTASFNASKNAPSSNFMGTTDTQTVTNKTFGVGTTITSLTTPLGVANGGTGTASSSANSYVTTDNTGNVTFTSTPLTPSSGGTSLTSLNASKFVTTNAIGTLETVTSFPASAIASTIGSTFTNKTIQTSNIGSMSAPLSVATGGFGVAPNATRALVGNGTSAVTELAVPSTAFVSTTGAQTLTGMTVNSSTLNLATPLAVNQGGTGQTTFTSGQLISTDSLGTGYTTLAAPSGQIVGINDTQALTNKTITDVTNTVTANSFTGSSGNVAIAQTSVLPGYLKSLMTLDTPNTCGVRWLPNTLVFVSTAPKTISFSTTQQSITPLTGINSPTFPANTLLIGSFVNFEYYCVIDGTSSDSFINATISCGFTSAQSTPYVYNTLNSPTAPLTLFIKGRIEIVSTGFIVGYQVYMGQSSFVAASGTRNMIISKNDPTVIPCDFTQNQTLDVQMSAGSITGTLSFTTYNTVIGVTDTPAFI